MKKNIERFLYFLVYSNIYLALGAGLVAVTTSLLVFNMFVWEFFYIPFAAGFFIYNLNRFTDLPEDMINIPKRAKFTKKYGVKLLLISAFAYILALFIALQKNLEVFIVTLVPFILAIFYSYFRFKKIILLKNILVSAAWAFSVLIVGASFRIWSINLILLYIFFFLAFLINVIIFDIKDIRGDKKYMIKTLPAILGIQKTRKICLGILLIICVFWIFQVLTNFSYVLLSPFLCYIFLYILLAKQNRPWWYYGIIVDGEFFMLIFLILLKLIWL